MRAPPSLSHGRADTLDHVRLTLAHPLGPDAHEAPLLGRVGCCLGRLDDPPGERGRLLRIGLGPYELLHLTQLVEHLLARWLLAPGLEALQRVVPLLDARLDVQ